MDFYIPKFGKEMYIKDGTPSVNMGFKGDYRAILTGPDGRVKSDTGWKSNTVLDSGLRMARNVDMFVRMYLGTSNTPVNIAQTWLQGSNLGYGNFGTTTFSENLGVSFGYGQVSVERVTFLSGVATGTINEFVCSNSSDPVNNTGVRVVLDVPIVKGAQDELNIEHKLTFYPQLTDATGVIEIGGDNPEDYNYVIRHRKVQAVPFRHFQDMAPPYWGNMNAGDQDLKSITDTANFDNIYVGGYTFSVGGSGPGTWYSNNEISWGINSELNNRTLRTMRGSMWHMTTDIGFGMQMRIGRVSDDAGIFKLNTHEIYLNWRTYPTRYAP